MGRHSAENRAEIEVYDPSQGYPARGVVAIGDIVTSKEVVTGDIVDGNGELVPTGPSVAAELSASQQQRDMLGAMRRMRDGGGTDGWVAQMGPEEAARVAAELDLLAQDPVGRYMIEAKYGV